jgi:EmrB/QacA subfamily drug resistance transporter
MPEQTISKKVILFIMTLSSFLTTFMGSAMNVALPSIGKEFSISAVMLSWVATSYLLTAALFLVPFGKIADIYGRKKIYLGGIILYSITSLACAIAPNAVFLIVARSVQGISGSMVFATGVAILSTVFPPGERGRALGLNLAATYLGLSTGPFFGGLLTFHFGWRSILYLTSLLAIVIIPLVLTKMKGDWAAKKGDKFDFKGSVVYMIGLFCIMYGFSLLHEISGVILVASGLIIIVLFFRMQKNAKYPVLDLSHFKKNVVFIFSNLAAFINYSATFAVGYLLSLYLQYVKGFNPQDAGLILVAQPITMALFSPLAGRLSDKLEPRLVASIGMILTTIGLIPFIFLTDQTPVIVIVATLLLIGVGFALFSSPNTNAIMSSVEPKFYGVASASVGTMRLTGQAISMGIVLLILSIYVGKVKITPENHLQFLSSMRLSFLIFTIICTAGIFASLARGKMTRSA